MTSDEFSSALKSLGLRQRWLADRLNMRPQVINRWATGETPVPSWMPFLLQLLREKQFLDRTMTAIGFSVTELESG